MMWSMRSILYLISAIIILTSIPPLLRGDMEPNNSPESSKAIESKDDVIGEVNILSDNEDWYSIFSESGKVLNLSVFIFNTSKLNVDVEIYDKNLNIQGYSRSHYQYESICILTPFSGNYYIRIYAVGGGGKYLLHAEVSECILAKDDGEYNGTLYNNSYHVSDIYRIYCEEGQILTVELKEKSLNGDVSMDLYLYDLWKNGNYRCLDFSWWGDPYERLIVKLPRSDYYYIVVTAYDGSGEYNIKINLENGIPEDDDFPPKCKNLFMSTEIRGSINQTMDHYDWYCFKLDRGEEISATLLLKNMSISGIYELGICNANLDVMISSTNYLMTEPPEISDNVRLKFKSEMFGTYYLYASAKVSVDEKNASNLIDASTSSDYILKINMPNKNKAPEVLNAKNKIYMYEDSERILDLREFFKDDNEGDVLTYSAESSEHLLTEVDGDILKIIPYRNWEGEEKIRVTAKDSGGLSASLDLTVHVLGINDPPTAYNDKIDITLEEGKFYANIVSLEDIFSDPDINYGDSLHFKIQSLDFPVFLNGTSLDVYATYDYDEFTVIVIAEDSEGEECDALITFHVITCEKIRVLNDNVQIFMNEDDIYYLTMDSIFSSQSKLSYTFWGNIKISILILDDGIVMLKPEKDWYGNETFYVEARTSRYYAYSNITVHISPMNDPPRIIQVIPDGIVGFNEMDNKRFVVRCIDVDNDNISYTWYLNEKNLNEWNDSVIIKVDAGVHHLRVCCADGKYSTNYTWLFVVEEKKYENKNKEKDVVRDVSAPITVAGISWILLVLIGTESGRFAFFKFLYLPLYTKIKKEEVLDRFNRGRIYGFIEGNPGAHYTLIKRKLNIQNGTLTYHLKMLEKEGFIKSEWDGIYKRFYPGKMPTNIAKSDLSGVQREILAIIKENPGISQKSISKKTGISPRVVSYHIKILVRGGCVKIVKEGKINRCYAQ